MPPRPLGSRARHAPHSSHRVNFLWNDRLNSTWHLTRRHTFERISIGNGKCRRASSMTSAIVRPHVSGGAYTSQQTPLCCCTSLSTYLIHTYSCSTTVQFSHVSYNLMTILRGRSPADQLLGHCPLPVPPGFKPMIVAAIDRPRPIRSLTVDRFSNFVAHGNEMTCRILSARLHHESRPISGSSRRPIMWERTSVSVRSGQSSCH